MIRSSLVVTALLLLTLPALAATPYHLELVASPATALPYLGKFGTVTIDVYPGGVRTDALWLYAFSRTGARTVTIANPLARMYVDFPVANIAATVSRLAGRHDVTQRNAKLVAAPILRGTVAGIDATRHRLVYGKDAWIDVWMTDVIPENAQYRAIVAGLLGGISTRTASLVRPMRGTPVYVVLHFRRFKNLELVKLKTLTYSSKGEEDALKLGPFYLPGTALAKWLGLE